LAADLVLFRLLGVFPVGKVNGKRRVRLSPDTDLTYRFNKGDIYSIHEVWFNKAYRFPSPIRTGVIVDLGANIGIASLWLAATYGATDIIAVEPSAANAALVRENFANNGIRGEVIEAAIAKDDGTAVFYEVFSSTNGRIETNISDSRTPPDGVTKVHTVRTVSMDTVLATLPPGMFVDLLKVDIEGGEQALLSGDVSWLSRVNAIVVEFHSALIDYPALIGVLSRFDFRSVQCISSDPIRGNTMEFFTKGGGLMESASETEKLGSSWVARFATV